MRTIAIPIGVSLLLLAGVSRAYLVWEFNWFTAAGGDEQFMNPDSWQRTPSIGIEGPPIPGERVYVSTSPEHPEARYAVLDSDVTTGRVYVGGWPEEVARDLGPAHEAAGELSLRDGSLTMVPDDAYLRVGYHGGRGAVDHSGGVLRTPRGVSIAAGDAGSIGLYHLRGTGEVVSSGFAVGVHGMGILRVSGGLHHGQNTTLGHGKYSVSRDTAIPGAGVMHQEGGHFRSTELRLGVLAGSVGQLRLTEDAVLESVFATVGLAGSGTEILLGGTHRVDKSYVLGQRAGSYGMLLIRGGEFRQGLAPGWGVYVGLGGHGQLRVEGPQATIDVGGNFVLSRRGTLTAVLWNEPPHVSPIRVGGSVLLWPDSTIRIQHGEGLASDPSDDFVPQPGQRFVLLRSDTWVFDFGAKIEPPGSWRVESDGREIALVYDGR